MYILLEYAGCVLLVSIVAATLFLAWFMALIIKEGGRVLMQVSRKIINAENYCRPKRSVINA